MHELHVLLFGEVDNRYQTEQWISAKVRFALAEQWLNVKSAFFLELILRALPRGIFKGGEVIPLTGLCVREGGANFKEIQ